MDEEPWVKQLYGVEIKRMADPEDKTSLFVLKYKTRKNVALCITTPERPSVIEALAYFRSDEKAQTFIKFLERIAHG